MDIVIDISPILELINLPIHIFIWRVFWYGGWIPIALAFLWGASQLWLKYIRTKWYLKQKFVLLAIDIPRDNKQTPKAVENIFSYLSGAHGSVNLIEKWWEGKFQLCFSLEIVSIDGYIQFLIHAPEGFRDLVESAIYSQYPDAEITEVNDYTKDAPSQFPDDEYDIWGCEFIQAKNPAYPIKTYKEFEHQIGIPEGHYKDPMAALMDLMSSLRKSEQLWFQIILIPTSFDWVSIGDKEISKIIGEKTEPSKNILDIIFDGFLGFLGYLSEMIFSIWGGVEEKEKKDQREDIFRILDLKPKEKKQIEAIQDKVSKLGFEFKIRFIYLSRKEVMNKPKVLNGFVGFMKQFAAMDLNNLMPDMKKTATKGEYFFKDYIANEKKRRIMAGYKDRDDTVGRKPGILNIEELASIWHFPIESVVKVPFIQKAHGRKAEAPISLPIGTETVSEELLEPIFAEESDSSDGKEEKDDMFKPHKENKTNNAEGVEKAGIGAEAKGTPPSNLPFA